MVTLVMKITDMTIPVGIATSIHSPYTLTPEQIDFYEKNRFIKCETRVQCGYSLNTSNTVITEKP